MPFRRIEGWLQSDFLRKLLLFHARLTPSPGCPGLEQPLIPMFARGILCYPLRIHQRQIGCESLNTPVGFAVFDGPFVRNEIYAPETQDPIAEA